MVALVAVMLILGSGAHPAPKKAQVSVSKRFEIEGKQVTEEAYRAKQRTLEGNFAYHCKKTTFGGVVSYEAHDSDGHWFRVVKVSGGTQPSTIERTDPPEDLDEADAG
jgi:hypothetical protein